MFCQDYVMVPYCEKEGSASLYQVGLTIFSRGVVYWVR